MTTATDAELARTPTSIEPRSRGIAREAILLFSVALAVRLVFLWAWHSADEVRGKDAWSFGYEAACTARSIAAGEGWAGQWNRAQMPWGLGSGTTGWLPPAYPALIAALVRACGGFTPLMAAALFAFQCVLSAATCLCLWGLGRAIGEAQAGRLAAWLFAFLPGAVWNAAAVVWDTTCVAFGISAFVFALFHYGGSPALRGRSPALRESSPTLARCLALGAAFGALMLLNPAPVSLAPVAIVWLASRERTWSARVRDAAAFTAAAFLVCLPWLARNERELGAFALRTNLGVELRAGNNDLANGYVQMSLHPSSDAAEFVRYREMGEVPYCAWALGAAKEWIRAHPLRFAVLTLHRVQLFWIGEPPPFDPRRELDRTPAADPRSWIKWLAHMAAGVLCLLGAYRLARARTEGRYLLAILLLFPGPYYLTHVIERYRFPIEPLIVLMVAYLCVRWFGKRRALQTIGAPGETDARATPAACARR
jgi:4-amino-4-deoxy-L-arabinose transferase-like glycosyltransferase